ncbi:uncharacterized protein LOC135145810 [Zophobas morio]|uniref:uncharacterized protein LOC135145810 n=1 Tax=Zophobas morio TaxID=2755281 RepID=UPI00308285D8
MELNSDSPSIPLTEESCISESNKDNFDNPLHVSNENETKYDNGNSNNNYSLLAETTTISNSSRCDLDPVEPLPLTSTARKFEKYVLLRLYYRPEDTPSGRKSHHHKKELLSSWRQCVRPVHVFLRMEHEALLQLRAALPDIRPQEYYLLSGRIIVMSFSQFNRYSRVWSIIKRDSGFHVNSVTEHNNLKRSFVGTCNEYKHFKRFSVGTDDLLKEKHFERDVKNDVDVISKKYSREDSENVLLSFEEGCSVFFTREGFRDIVAELWDAQYAQRHAKLKAL